MINEAGEPYLIEYNIRFGDPETQSILVRLESDFLEICLAAIDGNLADIEVNFSDKKAVTLVLAAKGYPASYQKGTEINLDAVRNIKDLHIFHAGTKTENGKLLANGGRVLNLTAIAENFNLACDIVYDAAERVDWLDKYYRTDIAQKVKN